MVPIHSRRPVPSPCQGEGRGFVSRRPLQNWIFTWIFGSSHAKALRIRLCERRVELPRLRYAEFAVRLAL